jgi:hypothetical protein
MNEIDNAFCPNKDCKDYGLQNHGNITVRGKYGKDKTKDLLYCRTCGKRFASTRATARLLGINKDTVNRVILRAGEHCELILSSLLRSLKLKETQLDELWSFVKKRKVLTSKSLAKSGSGQPSTRRQD